MAKLSLEGLSDEALVHKELSLERDLLEASFRLRTGQLEDNSKTGKVRRDIARVRTEERVRETAQGLNKDELRTRHRGTYRPQPVAASTGAGGETAQKGGFLSGLAGKLGIGDQGAEQSGS
jgi:large subunit ribosomal protein L29